MHSGAKPYPRVIRPATAKAHPSRSQPPPMIHYPSPQVLHTIEDHIRFRHRHRQPQESFFVADPDVIRQSVDRWRQLLPEVEPYYAVKCNNEQQLLRLLAGMDVGFDCASAAEICQVLSLGVPPERVIFASPYKDYDHIQYARVYGIQKTVFDSDSELHKLSQCHPDAELYLRIWADDAQCGVRLAHKFGAPVEYAKYLLRQAAALKVNIVGLCFHVGSSASDPSAYARAMADARVVYDEAAQRGFHLRSIDLGGGFTSANLTDASHALRDAMARHFGALVPTIHWMAEPGRLFVQDAFSLPCRVSGIRQVHPSQPVDIYVNDSIYKNFLNALAEPPIPTPLLLTRRRSVSDASDMPDVYEVPSPVSCTVWGQTCCGLDRIRSDFQFPRPVHMDDWILFPTMGAYSHVCASHFNGFRGHTEIVYVPAYRSRYLHTVPQPAGILTGHDPALLPYHIMA